MTALWPREYDEERRIRDSLQLSAPLTTDAAVEAVEIFARWDRRALDLPAPYYCQVFDWLYRENRLATGAFPALGRTIDLRNLRCPLFLLAGAQDAIAPPAQAFAAARLVGASESRRRSPCGHLALFMGLTLGTEWPRVAQCQK
jgi:poly(3-hydroxyalkanoate) synthetase